MKFYLTLCGYLTPGNLANACQLVSDVGGGGGGGQGGVRVQSG